MQKVAPFHSGQVSCFDSKVEEDLTRGMAGGLDGKDNRQTNGRFGENINVFMLFCLGVRCSADKLKNTEDDG